MTYEDDRHVAPECYDEILDECPQYAETGYVNLGAAGWPEVEFEPHDDDEIQGYAAGGGPVAATIPPIDTPEQFLKVIWGGELPDGWVTVLAKAAQGPPRTHASHSATVANAVRWAIAQNHSADVWFGIGLREQDPGPGKRGSTDDVSAIPGFWFDLDVLGPGHTETKLPETLEAAEQFLEALPLKPTIVVHSGGGFQAYWLFRNSLIFRSDNATRERVKGLSARWNRFLIAEGRQRGWRFDNTNDLARVLRVPGTWNRKTDTPVLVTVPEKHVNLKARYDLADFEAAMPNADTTPATTVRTASTPSSRTPLPQAQYPPANLELIVPRCAWLKHTHDDAATLPEPQWVAMISIVAHCGDGERHVHEWSRPHPQYTRLETEAKIRRAMTKAGPRTCEKIRGDFGEYCTGCSETVKSPIVLGRESALPMLPEVKVLELLPPANDLPAGFVRQDDGIWYQSKDSKGNDRIERVCSPISVVALTRNHDNEGWGMLIEVTDPDGNVNSWIMEKRLLSSYGDVYRQELLSRGLEINPAYGAQRLHEFISLVHPEKRLRTVSRVGWHGDVFLLPDATYGDAGCEEVRLYPDIKTHNFGVAGDLAEWQENVGKYCVSNSRLLFAVAIALAAPLLQLMDEGSGGFHYFGHSSRGKTTALLVAGSVCGGRGRNGYKSSWRATSNGLEGIAVAHCDGLLCLDEISEVNTRALHEAAYMLSNGMGKARATKSGEARAQAKWRLLYLSTGELTLADKLSEDGAGRATAGQSVRLVDIPAEADEHLGLFEELHGDPDAKTFAERLGKGSREFYGSALRSFLERLTAELPAARGKVARVKEGFQSTYCPPDADSQVTRVCSRFALVAAAGELGIEYGVLPWSQGASVSAAAKCFQAWLRNRGGVGALELQQGVAQVKAFFLKHGSSRFEIWGENESSVTYNRAGFRRKDSNGAWAYYVPKAIFDNEIAKGFDARRLLNEFKRLGLLIPGSDGSPSRVVRDPAIGKTSRYYHFRADIVGDSVTEAPLAPGASLQAVTGDPAGDSGLLQEKDREIKHVTAVTGVTGDSPCNEDAFVSEENVAEILGMGRTRRSAEAQEHTYSF